MSPQTFPQQLMTIALCALATVLTRALPFVLFPASRPAPKWVTYLGQALPAAVFACWWCIACAMWMCCIRPSAFRRRLPSA